MKVQAIKIVEIEKQLGVPELNEASAASVASLRDHPGMQYLLAKFRLQAAALKTVLTTQRQKDLNDVEFLQSGIAWCSWLQQQLDKALQIQNQPKPRPARPQELETFEELSSRIDWVGASKRPNGRGDNTETNAPQVLGA